MKLLESLFAQGVTSTKAIMDAYLKRGPVKVTFRKNVGHRVGGFPSRKVGRYVIYGGPEEMKAMFWLEFRNDVVIFLEQPMEIAWADGHIYTPDLLILFSDGSLEVWDPKPEFFYDDEFKQIEAIVKQKLAAYGIGFRVMTEDKLPPKDFIENLGLILQYRTHPIEAKKELLSRWPLYESLTIDELCCGALGETLDFGEIINMVGRGHLSLNLNEAIDDDTPVSLGLMP